MELQHLRSFLAAVELGSFNRAAATLNYTGPAISQHVAALEEAVGVRLLERHARGVEPTAAGEFLSLRAAELLDLVAGTVRDVQLVAAAPTTVRIGAFSTAAQHLLPPVLTSMLTRSPELELELIDREPPDGFNDVVAGRLDVMVTHTYSGCRLDLPPNLTSVPLLVDDLVLIVPDGHRVGDRVRLGELAGDRWISGPPDAQNHIALEWAARRAGFVPEVAFETTDYAVTMTLVENGLGPAFIPRLTMPVAPDGVREVSVVDANDLRRDISIVHRDPIRSDVVRLVVEQVLARADRMQAC